MAAHRVPLSAPSIPIGNSSADEKDVAWFEIPMNHSTCVSMLDGVSQACNQLSRLPRRGEFRLLAQPLRQVNTGAIGGRNVAGGSDLIRLIDGHEVGMLETGRDLRLAMKAPADFGRQQRVGTRDLQCHVPAQPWIVGPINNSESAATQ